ncbi:septation protein SepH [Tenggerimyces flavus]|uniref:Septation protein SepH n=1 Tax=Tenggerimyces flavus TaxID=1708749 RepID=A0ABV7YP13_9ACTN|nr:septation protein SepH [Tenggerimyces flavus]MBM7787688.1 hypothetical protein [Tenggerimyces flavus]
MRDIKLVRLSEDGTHLVLTHEGTGEEYALRVDDRLRGAVVSDRARQGQLEEEAESRLRPKEIQARLRSGESSETIAAAAGVPIERILRYAGPVLAEREYIAEQARKCALRRHAGEGSGQVLEDAVVDRLSARGPGRVSPVWDAWRTDDGRWAIAVSYAIEDESHQAVFSFDPLGRVVMPADDDARWLAGEPGALEGPTARTPRDGHRLRLAPVPEPAPASDEETEAEFVAEADLDADDGEDTVDLRGLSVRAVEPDLDPDEVAELDDPPVREARPVAPVPSPPPSRPQPHAQPRPQNRPQRRQGPKPTPPAQAPAEAPAAEAANGTEQRRPTKRSRGSRRATVPSWDEILFGGSGGGRRER